MLQALEIRMFFHSLWWSMVSSVAFAVVMRMCVCRHIYATGTHVYSRVCMGMLSCQLLVDTFSIQQPVFLKPMQAFLPTPLPTLLFLTPMPPRMTPLPNLAEILQTDEKP